VPEFALILGVHDLVRAKGFDFIDLALQTGECNEVRAHRSRVLHGEVAQPADADGSDGLARARLAITRSGEKERGSGARQRRHARRVHARGHFEDEALVGDVVRGEAALRRRAVDTIATAVRRRHELLAIDLDVLAAPCALAARVDLHADEHGVALLEGRHRGTHRDHFSHSHDLVAGDERMRERPAHFVVDVVNVRVPHAGIQDAQGDVRWAKCAPLEDEGFELALSSCTARPFVAIG
jgi:hypothetical protein